MLLQEVVGTSAATSDQVIPNSVVGAPLSGTEPLIAALGLAPAVLIAAGAAYVDLDGPLLLAKDREPGLAYEGSTMTPPPVALWG